MIGSASTRFSTRTAAGVIIGVSVLGFFVVMIATTRYGPGVNPDSANYIAAAKSLLAGRGFVRYDGDPFVHWPPLFPSVLALLELTGIDPVVGARWLNAGLFALVIAVSGTWFLKVTRRPVMAAVGTLALLSVPLLDISVHVMSDPLFVLLTILALWKMQDFLASPGVGPVLTGAVLVALACLTRYLGVTLAATGCVLLLLDRGSSVRRRLGNGLLFGGLSVLPLALWLWRNLLVVGSLAGRRHPSPNTLVTCLSQTGTAFAAMLLPWQAARMVPGLVWLGGLVVLLLVCIRLVLRRRAGRGLDWRSPGLLPSAAFIVVYVAALNVSTVMVYLNTIQLRFLSPVVASLVLVLLLACAEAFPTPKAVPTEDKRRPRSRRLRGVLAAAAVLLILLTASRAVVRVVLWVEDGAGGCNRKRFRESATVAYVRTHDLNDPLYCNKPEVLWFLAGRRSVKSPLRPYSAADVAGRSETDHVRGWFGQGDAASFVWLDGRARSYIYRPAEIAEHVEMTLVADLPDGAVYEVR